MTRKIAAVSISLMVFAIPFIALADGLSDALDQARFMASRAAAQQANFDISKPSCAATASKPVVQAKERFILAWGSFGAIDTASAKNVWAPNGAYEMVVDKPGAYSYSFMFYGAGGAPAFCAATVVVK